MVGLTKTLAKEWGQFKINVNAVAFGWIETRLTASAGVVLGNSITTSSGTNAPLAMMSLACKPIGVPAATAARSRSMAVVSMQEE